MILITSEREQTALIRLGVAFGYCRLDWRERRRLLVHQRHNVSSVLRPVCAAVVGIGGSLCVCVSVGWCQYLTVRRKILKRSVSEGPYLHPE